MKDCLVDVLNARDTVLHVFPIALENHDGTQKTVDPVQEALELAAHLHLAPEHEVLHARPHICRSGPLMPYGDVLKTKHEMFERTQQRIRERAYFLWQQDGRTENRADEHWRQANEVESSY